MFNMEKRYRNKIFIIIMPVNDGHAMVAEVSFVAVSAVGDFLVFLRRVCCSHAVQLRLSEQRWLSVLFTIISGTDDKGHSLFGVLVCKSDLCLSSPCSSCSCSSSSSSSPSSSSSSPSSSSFSSTSVFPSYISGVHHFG